MNTIELKTEDILKWWDENPHRNQVFMKQDQTVWSSIEVHAYVAQALQAGNVYHLISPDGAIRAGLIYQADNVHKVLNLIVIIAKGPGLFRQMINAWQHNFPGYKVTAPRPKKFKRKLNTYNVHNFSIIK